MTDKERKIRRKETCRRYYEAHKKEILARCKKWAESHKEQRLASVKKYQKSHPEKVKETKSHRDRDKAREYSRKRRIEHPELHRLYAMRRKSTVNGNINARMSCNIQTSLKRNKGYRHWEELAGYTLSELMAHLEKQFQPGMTWGNRGQWHIDHKTPLRVFNITSSDDIDFKRAWALSNLQPLWASDNHSKSGKIGKPFQPALALAV